MSFLLTVCFCLILTIVIEVPVALLMTKQRRFLLYSIRCNLITNPPLNIAGLLLLQFFGMTAYICFAVVGESTVVLTEMWLYAVFDHRRSSLRRYFVLSLVCNAVSFLTGLLLSFVP